MTFTDSSDTVTSVWIRTRRRAGLSVTLPSSSEP